MTNNEYLLTEKVMHEYIKGHDLAAHVQSKYGISPYHWSKWSHEVEKRNPKLYQAYVDKKFLNQNHTNHISLEDAKRYMQDFINFKYDFVEDITDLFNISNSYWCEKVHMIQKEDPSLYQAYKEASEVLKAKRAREYFDTYLVHDFNAIMNGVSLSNGKTRKYTYVDLFILMNELGINLETFDAAVRKAGVRKGPRYGDFIKNCHALEDSAGNLVSRETLLQDETILVNGLPLPMEVREKAISYLENHGLPLTVCFYQAVAPMINRGDLVYSPKVLKRDN